MTATLAARGLNPLTRQRILEAALCYIDEHGLETLSMHKLGAQLGVKGMSLYNHVANKDDLLDGVVETLWAEIEAAAPAQPDWQQGYQLLAREIRAVIHRHPNAAALITTQQIMPAAALRAVRAHITVAIDAGVPPAKAYPLLRTLTSYALGYGLAYVGYGQGCHGCAPSVSDLLRPGVPDDLAAVAEVFCGQSDPDVEFALGVDLMLRE